MKTQSPQLRWTALSTFEDLGFVCPDEELNESQSESELAYGARVEFTGPSSGWLEVQSSRDVLRTVTENMLGPDVAEDEAVQRDALGEITNVICGNFVPTLGTPADVFDLKAPMAVSVADDVDAQWVEDLGVDAGRIRVRVHVATQVVSP